MKNLIKFVGVFLGFCFLCGCSNMFGNDAKLDEINTPNYHIVDYSAVKEGYYLSDSGDGSYYLIKDGKLSLLEYDWEKEFRERNPISEHSDMTESEYEEFVNECVADDIKNHTDKPFTPVKYDDFDIYVMLVIDPSPEYINSNGFDGSATGIHMKDENTISTEPPYYVYCGTSLPESE